MNWSAGGIMALRVRLKLTQEAFAVLLGVRTETVNRWERGVSTPRGLSAAALDRVSIKGKHGK